MVTIWIQGIGTLGNAVVEEPDCYLAPEIDAEPPDPLSDQALAEAGRVILAIEVDRVTAANYIPEATRQAQSQLPSKPRPRGGER